MTPKILQLLIATCLLTSCSQGAKKATDCASNRYNVYLYVNNLSFRDTIAYSKVIIDDSTYLDQKVPHSSNSSNFHKIARLCEGNHRLKVVFGRFEKDTALTVTGNISLFIDMNYLEIPLKLSPNGINVSTLARDGKPAID